VHAEPAEFMPILNWLRPILPIKSSQTPQYAQYFIDEPKTVIFGSMAGLTDNAGPAPSPRALDAFVRQRTPVWLEHLLKTKFDETVSLEDMFANCWVL